MNMPVIRDSNTWGGLVVGAILTAIGGLIGGGILHGYENKDEQLTEHDRSISKLEVEESTQLNENARTEAAITSINNNITSILGAIQGLKAGSDDQTTAMHELQHRFDDVDAILRPMHRPSDLSR